MEPETNQRPPRTRRGLSENMVAIVAGAALALAGWSLTSTVSLRERVAVIEDGIFKKRDAAALEARIIAEQVKNREAIVRCINQIQRGEDCDL